MGDTLLLILNTKFNAQYGLWRREETVYGLSKVKDVSLHRSDESETSVIGKSYMTRDTTFCEKYSFQILTLLVYYALENDTSLFSINPLASQFQTQINKGVNFL